MAKTTIKTIRANIVFAKPESFRNPQIDISSPFTALDNKMISKIELAKQAKKYINYTIAGLEKAGYKSRQTTSGVQKVTSPVTSRNAVTIIKQARRMIYNPLSSVKKIKELEKEAIKENKYLSLSNTKIIVDERGRPKVVSKRTKGQLYNRQAFRKNFKTDNARYAVTFDDFKEFMSMNFPEYDSDQVITFWFSTPSGADPIEYWRSKLEREKEQEKEERENIFGKPSDIIYK